MASEPFRVASIADLEVAVLYEAHDLLASAISPSVYTVAGSPPDQVSSFANPAAFELFVIRVGEFIAEAPRNVAVADAPANISVLSGLDFIAPRLPEQCAVDLSTAVGGAMRWLDAEDPCRFWCPGLNTTIEFNMTRGQIWRIHANNSKHTFLRLQKVTEQLRARVSRLGIEVDGAAILHVLDSFGEWALGYCQYHASMVTELLGQVFFAVNDVVWERYRKLRIPGDRPAFKPPRGTSPYFSDLHSSLLAFRRYDGEARIAPLIPSTAATFRQTYGP